MLGYPEIILILAVVLLIFGPSKLPEMARALGSAMREFQKATTQLEAQAKILENSVTLPPPSTLIRNELEKPLSSYDKVASQNEADQKEISSHLEPNTEIDLYKLASMLEISQEGKTRDQLRDEIMNRVKSLGEDKEGVE